MKPIIPCLLTLILAAWSTQAEVVVYKKTQRAHLIGQTLDFRVSATGFVVLDASGRSGFEITVYNIRGDKFFTVSPFEPRVRFYSVTGAAGRTHSTWVRSGITNNVFESQDFVEFAIGKEVALAITPTNSVNLPRVVTGTLGGVAIPNGQAAVAVSGTGVLSYSQKETRLANGLGEAVADTVARIRAGLLNRGFREVN